MELVKPDIGLLFWMTTCFVLLLFIMRRYAWGPILKSLNERDEGIQRALNEAAEAKQQVSEAAEKVTKILEDGKLKRESLITETQAELSDYKKEQKNKINIQISAELKAAKEEIDQQKRSAIIDLKDQVAELSIEIAEKILKKSSSMKFAYIEGEEMYERILMGFVK